jgi:guanine deaminase
MTDPKTRALRARKTALANNLDKLLFAMIVLGDDRLVDRTVISQAG